MTRVDTQNYGYNPKSVTVSDSIGYLNAIMKSEYLEKAKERGITEKDALADYLDQKETCEECQFCENGYAYISFDYYWDIFEAEVV